MKIDSSVGRISEELLSQVDHLARFVFPDFDSAKLKSRVSEKEKVSLFYVLASDELVAFKIGYQKDEKTYYSWLGCVSESHRGEGIAAELMQAQHDWAKSQGYRFVETKTMNMWKSMLKLNLKSGFHVVEGADADQPDAKILMRKEL